MTEPTSAAVLRPAEGLVVFVDVGAEEVGLGVVGVCLEVAADGDVMDEGPVERLAGVASDNEE